MALSDATIDILDLALAAVACAAIVCTLFALLLAFRQFSAHKGHLRRKWARQGEEKRRQRASSTGKGGAPPAVAMGSDDAADVYLLEEHEPERSPTVAAVAAAAAAASRAGRSSGSASPFLFWPLPWGMDSRYRVLQVFNALWGARLALVFVAIVWLLAQVIRLPLLFTRWDGGDALLTTATVPWQKQICRIKIVVGEGFGEPAFFLLALFILRHRLGDAASFASHAHANARVLRNALLVTIPVTVAHFVIVYHATLSWYINASIGNSFTEGYQLDEDCKLYEVPAGSPVGSGPPPPTPCALCQFPLLSSFISGVFALAYVPYLALFCHRLAPAVINMRLRRRLRALQLLASVLLPASALLRGFTAFAEPSDRLFEALAAAHFLVVVIACVACPWLLVFRPLFDASGVAATMVELPLSRLPMAHMSGRGAGASAVAHRASATVFAELEPFGPDARGNSWDEGGGRMLGHLPVLREASSSGSKLEGSPAHGRGGGGGGPLSPQAERGRHRRSHDDSSGSSASLLQPRGHAEEAAAL